MKMNISEDISVISEKLKLLPNDSLSKIKELFNIDKSIDIDSTSSIISNNYSSILPSILNAIDKAIKAFNNHSNENIYDADEDYYNPKFNKSVTIINEKLQQVDNSKNIESVSENQKQQEPFLAFYWGTEKLPISAKVYITSATDSTIKKVGTLRYGDSSNGTYEVLYDDGSNEINVLPDRITCIKDHDSSIQLLPETIIAEANRKDSDISANSKWSKDEDIILWNAHSALHQSPETIAETLLLKSVHSIAERLEILKKKDESIRKSYEEKLSILSNIGKQIEDTENQLVVLKGIYEKLQSNI